MSHLTLLRLSFLSCSVMCRIICLSTSGAVFKIKCVILIVCLVFFCNCDKPFKYFNSCNRHIIQWIKYHHYWSLPEGVQGTWKYSQLDFKMYCSVVSDSWQPHGLQPIRLLCPMDSPGKNTGEGCHFLFQGIFLTQGLNPRLLHLLHCRQILYHWATGEAPWNSQRIYLKIQDKV